MISRELVRLGGLAGIGVAVFILPFAASDGMIGGLFAHEVLHGESAEGWLVRIRAHPELARIAITLPMIGFTLMLLVGATLFRMIDERHWSATLGIVGYLVGSLLAVSAFVSATSLIWAVAGAGQGNSTPPVEFVTAELHRFMLVNLAFGPFFLIVIGKASMLVAAWRVKVLPRWLCAWGLANAAIMVLGIASIWLPALKAGQIAGPLTMLWYMVLESFC